MTVLEIENTAEATTEHWSASPSDGVALVRFTRHVALDALLGELETLEIERNAEFHATLVSRLVDPSPSLIETDEALGE